MTKSSTKGENGPKRRGRPRNEDQVSVPLDQELQTKGGSTIGKIGQDGHLILSDIPTNVSPVEWLEQRAIAVLQRVEEMSKTGKLGDAVKLKANQTLLNKIIPDVNKTEFIVTESPYDKIMRAIEERERETLKWKE